MKIISVCDDLSKAQNLISSLNKFCWDHNIIETRWHGFGTKLLLTREYLLSNPDIKEFIFLDAYDTCALSTPTEFMVKLDLEGEVDAIMSTEVNCWPDSTLYYKYPTTTETKFKFINSGTYYMKSKFFLMLMDKHWPNYDTDDQLFMTKRFFDYGNEHFILDYNRNFFQTTCGMTIEDGEFGFNRFITDLGTKPIFMHGNGKGDMSKIYAIQNNG